jgi:uncharacterized protein (DUF2062 family)
MTAMARAMAMGVSSSFSPLCSYEARLFSLHLLIELIEVIG